MDAYSERLSEYLDDELTSAEREAMEAHLTSCVECRRILADLRAVVDRAAALPPRPPTLDLWPGVAARLEPRRRSPIVQIGGFLKSRHAPGTPRRFSFTATELAAAALILIVTSAGLSWLIRTRMHQPGSELQSSSAAAVVSSTTSSAADVGVPAVRVANFADAQYDAAVADLQRALEEGRGRLNPKTIAVLEKNLTIIDEAIEQARRAVASDPANTYLNSYLADARRRKLDLLREAAAALANLPS